MENVQRETMEFDVLFVGGGAASLSGAIHLTSLIKKYNETATKKLEPLIGVVEKGSEIGAHSLSGAVLNPVSLKELVPDFKEKGCPIEAEVNHDAVYFLGEKSAFKFPVTPPPFKNHGHFVISLSKFNRWLLCK